MQTSYTDVKNSNLNSTNAEPRLGLDADGRKSKMKSTKRKKCMMCAEKST
jgi:hypothetical protein